MRKPVKKRVKKNQIPIVLIIVLAFFTIFLWRVFACYAPMAEGKEAGILAGISTSIFTEKIGAPVRIKIPSITLDAKIERVALTAGGSMAVPKNPHNVGWYELGPRPGDKGSAVIAGHLDWYYGDKAVFANLRKIKPGNEIIIQDDTGAIVYFVVREIRIFKAGADATSVFSSNDGQAHLNLVTCDGRWNTKTKQYSNRLVVFSDKKIK